MTLYLYLFSFGMLIFFSILTGDMHLLSAEKIAILGFLLILGYAALVVGGFLDPDEERESRKTLRK